MTDLEFIEKEIQKAKELLQRLEKLKVISNKYELQLNEVLEKDTQEKLFYLQQIKSILEAWEVVKKHCDYQDYDRFNCIPEGFYLIEPIKGKDYLTIKKALEVENES